MELNGKCKNRFSLAGYAFQLSKIIQQRCSLLSRCTLKKTGILSITPLWLDINEDADHHGPRTTIRYGVIFRCTERTYD